MAAPALALLQSPEFREKVKSVGHSFAKQFGLTEDDEYVGWRLLALVGFELWENVLKAPVAAGYHIEQQIAGVLQKAYEWLGGSGLASKAGNDVLAAVSPAYAFATGQEQLLLEAVSPAYDVYALASGAYEWVVHL